MLKRAVSGEFRRISQADHAVAGCPTAHRGNDESVLFRTARPELRITSQV